MPACCKRNERRDRPQAAGGRAGTKTPPPPNPLPQGEGEFWFILPVFLPSFPPRLLPFTPSPTIAPNPPAARINRDLCWLHRRQHDLPVPASLGRVTVTPPDGGAVRIPTASDPAASDARGLLRRAHRLPARTLPAELGQAGLCDRAVRSRDRHPERLRTVAPALPPTGAEIAGHARHARGATDLAAGHCVAAVSLGLRARTDQLECCADPGLCRAQRSVRHLDADRLPRRRSRGA